MSATYKFKSEDFWIFTETEARLVSEDKSWERQNIQQHDGQYCTKRNYHLQMPACPHLETPFYSTESLTDT